MAGNDVNRIIIGNVETPFSEENYRRLHDRVLAIEKILHTQTRQWNAPSLLRCSNDHLIQLGVVTLLPAYWSGTTGQVHATWAEAYDAAPLGVVSITDNTLNVTTTCTLISNITTTGADICVRSTGTPTSGSVKVIYLVVGKKVEP